jgi:hypothetical protein
VLFFKLAIMQRRLAKPHRGFRARCAQSDGATRLQPSGLLGIIAAVVNARHVKAVPGRKTDVADAQWLASLARAGLLNASFVPKADIRHLRLISRQRQKLVGMLASEKNRIHKVLSDAGKFQTLKIRKGHKRSIVALAHKMLRIIYAMLSKQT